MIIDFHTHTFPAKISAGVLEKLSRLSRTAYFTDGSADALAASMRKYGIDYSINLPVMTNVNQVEKVNSALIAGREELYRQGIITFGGMHPDYSDYKTELARLKQNGILGIKLHPAYQNTDIDDIRMMRIMDTASELGLIILTHAGIDIGIYEHNYASVSQLLKVVDTLHPEKFVLAHMGNWGCWDVVERELAGAPVWLDTAFAIGPVTPNPKVEGEPYLSYHLSDEAFVRLVRKHGAHRVLFATDSPWEDQGSYVERINKTALTKQEKELIFSENAKKLLKL